MDYSPPGCFVHGIFQARILECVAISPPRELPCPEIEPTSPAYLLICRQILYNWATWKAQVILIHTQVKTTGLGIVPSIFQHCFIYYTVIIPTWPMKKTKAQRGKLLSLNSQGVQAPSSLTVCLSWDWPGAWAGVPCLASRRRPLPRTQSLGMEGVGRAEPLQAGQGAPGSPLPASVLTTYPTLISPTWTLSLWLQRMLG